MQKMDLGRITKVLDHSNKWLGHYYEEYPNLYAVYHYAPKPVLGRWCKIVIPLLPGGGRKPDLNKPWFGKIMTDDYGLVTIQYKPLGSQASFEAFAQWLYVFVNFPEKLMMVGDVGDNSL